MNAETRNKLGEILSNGKLSMPAKEEEIVELFSPDDEYISNHLALKLGYDRGIGGRQDVLLTEESFNEVAALFAHKIQSIPYVNGADCPACGHPTLILANDGYITCSLEGCPNPDYAEAFESHIQAIQLEARLDELDRVTSIKVSHPEGYALALAIHVDRRRAELASPTQPPKYQLPGFENTMSDLDKLTVKPKEK